MNTLRNIFIILVFIIALIISYSASATHQEKVDQEPTNISTEQLDLDQNTSCFEESIISTKKIRSHKVNVSYTGLFQLS